MPGQAAPRPGPRFAIEPKAYMKDDRRALQPEALARDRRRPSASSCMAGHRGQGAETAFLFFRLVVPGRRDHHGALFYLFVLEALDQSPTRCASRWCIVCRDTSA